MKLNDSNSLKLVLVSAWFSLHVIYYLFYSFVHGQFSRKVENFTFGHNLEAAAQLDVFDVINVLKTLPPLPSETCVFVTFASVVCLRSVFA